MARPTAEQRPVHANQQVVFVKTPLRSLRKASACKRAGGINQSPAEQPTQGAWKDACCRGLEMMLRRCVRACTAFSSAHQRTRNTTALLAAY
eukprot:8378955-Pyramimonas_sp.AAC.1